LTKGKRAISAEVRGRRSLWEGAHAGAERGDLRKSSIRDSRTKGKKGELRTQAAPKGTSSWWNTAEKRGERNGWFGKTRGSVMKKRPAGRKGFLFNTLVGKRKEKEEVPWKRSPFSNLEGLNREKDSNRKFFNEEKREGEKRGLFAAKN